MSPRPGTGALDEHVGLRHQLRPEIDYRRPRRGGEALFDLVGDLTGQRILDLGCGHAPYRGRLESRGARWFGLELEGTTCSVIASGDRLPFGDGVFDGVLCAAVLEHLPEPDAVMAEMWRVIRPGGILFGYVSFLEPFHGMSYYHMTHMGLEYLLLKHGFRPSHIFPPRNGTAYQLECLLFPKYVPVLQPIFRSIVQWSVGATMAVNRFARKAFHVATRRNGPMPGDTNDYARLLPLRFAVGFNFVAERGPRPESVPSGYAPLVKG